MNQAGMILALILLSIPAEMVKGSRASKRSKPSKSSKRSKSSQYNTIQYSTIQFSTIQLRGSIGQRSAPARLAPYTKGNPPGSEQDTGGSNTLIPLSRLPGSPGPDNRCRRSPSGRCRRPGQPPGRWGALPGQADPAEPPPRPGGSHRRR